MSTHIFAEPLQSALDSHVVVEGQLPGAEQFAPPAPEPLMQQTWPAAQFDFEVHVYVAPAHAAPVAMQAPMPPTTQQTCAPVHVNVPHFIGVIVDGESAGVSLGGGVVSVVTGVSPGVVSVVIVVSATVPVSSAPVSEGKPVPVSSSNSVEGVAPSLLHPKRSAVRRTESVR